ncbi:glycosyltransferase family 2 protein [Croceimicrobium sp.]|uniref:glycosyltransferase family 2 protein n=1 Tax=Croceimicrobium sp. TaxID=2828340 RepID=UPI003BAB53D2
MWLKLLYKIKSFKALLYPAQAVQQAPLFIAAVFKNEAPFLKEWLDFHLSQGVSRIYLSDNFSSDNPEAVLKPYLDKNQVVLLKSQSPEMNTRLQALELNRLLKRIENQESKDCWIATIDVDEFLFHHEGQKLDVFLQQFKGQKVAAVVVNWLMFGTSNLPKLDPQKSMLEQLSWRAHWSLGEHKMVKPILYLANCQGFLEGPHRPFAKNGAKFLYSDCSTYQAEEPRILHEPLRLNHYWYRSEEYYNSEKRLKRQAFGDERSGKREADHIKACNYEQDFSILKHQASTKER